MPNSVPFSGKSCPSPIIVLADDITGAAEIAGIAYSHGLKTKLTTTIGTPADGCDVLVLATDWRQMPEQEAMEESRRATAFYAKISDREGRAPMIFKKTDSVLRGHILAECFGMLSALKENEGSDDNFRVLLIPQNPSKGRVVRGGLYYINEKPIAETSFSFDPEFPAKSSVVTDILRENLQDKALNPDVCAKNAETIEEIQQIVTANKADKIIFAGGADLFSSILSIYHNSSVKSQQTSSWKDRAGKAIIVCGSTQSADISKTKFCMENDFVLTKMPAEVFHGKEISADGKNPAAAWFAELKDIYMAHNLILTIGHKPQGGPSYAIRLRNLMADAVKKLSTNPENSTEEKLIQKTSAPDLLIIEGGATAFQILQTLGWTEFLVSKELAPGVVVLKYQFKDNAGQTKDKPAKETTIILKPGSYPWGNSFFAVSAL